MKQTLALLTGLVAFVACGCNSSDSQDGGPSDAQDEEAAPPCDGLDAVAVNNDIPAACAACIGANCCDPFETCWADTLCASVETCTVDCIEQQGGSPLSCSQKCMAAVGGSDGGVDGSVDDGGLDAATDAPSDAATEDEPPVDASASLLKATNLNACIVGQCPVPCSNN